jgi:hypothetical protein
VSHGDGWPSYAVDVEHLPDRSLRLWLRHDGTATSLGTVQGSRGLHPVARERVAAQLDLTDPEFLVELRVPRPPYVRDGDRVTVPAEDGRRVEGVVRGWVQGEVMVDVSPGNGPSSGLGLWPPDEVTYPGG